VRWVILVIFLFGMLSSLNWYEARTTERKLVYGVMTIAAFVLVVLLVNTTF
jgi:hypothetical protein